MGAVGVGAVLNVEPIVQMDEDATSQAPTQSQRGTPHGDLDGAVERRRL